MGSLRINNYSVTRSGDRLLAGASMDIKSGEVHILRGANGAGKSSLLLALMGDDRVVGVGEVLMNDKSLSALPIHERAKAGLFMSFQDLPAFPGITIAALTRSAFEARFGEQGAPQFFLKLREALRQLELEEAFIDREVGVGLSGGEKKRFELLLMLLMEPEVALLDEIDAGLDAAGKAFLLKAIISARARGTCFLIVTHQEDFAKDLEPTRIWKLEAGRVI
jgi:Fe-S cluster assembly ATP-binding protein